MTDATKRKSGRPAGTGIIGAIAASKGLTPRELIVLTLNQTGGNITAAARLLGGIRHPTLIAWMQRENITVKKSFEIA